MKAKWISPAAARGPGVSISWYLWNSTVSDEMAFFAESCGHTLALSHARSGDAAMISGYLGRRDVFDEAVASFSVAHADQNEEDHAALKRAIRAGKVKALIEKAK